MTSSATAIPVPASKPVDRLTIDEVKAELRSYAYFMNGSPAGPFTQAQVRTDEGFLQRRADLWARLDNLIG